MAEGDTIFRTARTLQRALAGRTVTRFESPLPALTRVDEDEPIAGRTAVGVRERRTALPALRHADRLAQAGRIGAPHLLAPAVPEIVSGL
jgi:formamidopyrimidine-DNA glycosylase